MAPKPLGPQQHMSASTVSEVPGSGAYAGRSHAEYRRARRHSRLVRILKILLPLSAGLIVMAFVAVSWLDQMGPEGVEIESVSLRDGKLVMQNPVMSGQGSDARPYTMQAARAIQDLTTPDVIMLEEIVADLPVSNGDKAVLKALSGIYDRAAQTLEFDQPFTVTTEAGMQADLQSADIDIAGGEMSTSEPVSVRSKEASVVAQSMQMQDKGRVIVFKDKVRMTINPSALKSKDGATN
ncbi:hypothetical protein LL06_17925 [Hoeflea sp. BAL378]|nr:hypothetical protein LL06_17925 [Hoeflea sp. BAL378]